MNGITFHTTEPAEDQAKWYARQLGISYHALIDSLARPINEVLSDLGMTEEQLILHELRDPKTGLLP